MDIDAAQIASAVMPYATAVVAAYGKETADKIRDLAVSNVSDATIQLGQKMLYRILRRDQSRASIEEALIDVANGQEDSEPALRLQIRKVLASDPELVHEIAALLPQSHNEASGEGSIAIGQNSGIARTGDASFNVGAQHNHGPGTFIGRDFNYGAEGA